MSPRSELSAGNSDAAKRASRLLEARKFLGKSRAQMGALVGISSQSWEDYENGAAVPKVPVYEALRAIGFNPAWLLGDEGVPVRADAAITPAAVVDEELVALPRYAVQAAAGDGLAVIREELSEWIYFRRSWLKQEIGVNAGNLAIITARGDSMAPTIKDGDLLIVDATHKRWTRDGIYVIGVEDDLWVKRVDRLRSGGLVLSSDNPQHQHGTETIKRAHLSTVRFVGRVVWSGGRR